ncbi:MAG TPA: nuclear transport factor 2 family protein [Solirubrobacterales bacterium]|nr:nuclear transport factor 2 family protein [Solirubrobacterales bacterium]
MSPDQQSPTEFVEGYGRTWESWDAEGNLELFSDDVVYVVHATEETVVGRDALRRYIAKEEAAMGKVSVRMGEPVVGGDHVAAEFWVTLTTDAGEKGTIAGCFIAELDPADGLCTHFREYWFEVEGHIQAYPGWGGRHRP